ncbi:fibronectin type III domain-containing protein [Desulfolithobacter sp.]
MSSAKAVLFLFASILLCCGRCVTVQAAPAKEHPRDQVAIHIAPDARQHILNRVALLSFTGDSPDFARQVTALFHQALERTGKYRLLALEKTQGWQTRHVKPDPVQAGRDLDARGVITGQIRGSYSLSGTDPAQICTISMTDAWNGRTLWEIRSKLPWRKGSKNLSMEKTMENLAYSLVRKLVATGDIYSPLLPVPQVISTQGDLRRNRIILQPDPPHIYTAYQLLRSTRADGIFRAVTEPVPNSQGLLILEDAGLEDGTTYYYTVIGLTTTGLANIPAAPLAVTTVGTPLPVSRFHAAGNSLRSIRLFWEPSQDPRVNGYVLFRSERKTGPFEKIATIDGRDRQTYTDNGEQTPFSTYGSLKDSTEYFYSIKARNIVGVLSKDAPVVSAITKGAPPPPSKVRAIEGQPRRVDLFWTRVTDPDVKGYAIWRSSSASGPFKQIDFVDGRDSQNFTDDGTWGNPLLDHTRYFYKIQSINVVDVRSRDSAIVSAITKPAPRPVSGLQAKSRLFRQVVLTWSPNPEPDISTYQIFRGETMDRVTDRVDSVKAEQTTFIDRGLKDGRTYWYQVRAVDRDGLTGQMSNPVQATTKPPPAPPVHVQARCTPEGIHLSWDPGPEPDIVHYEIFTTGFLATRAGESTEPRFLYRVDPEPGRKYSLWVVAVDADGLNSENSQTVSITCR